jgi:hypothetical protein
MSFVNRKLYKQKPQAWGPVSSVQASIFKNTEKIGIDKNSLISIIPLWEKAGIVIHDYSKLKIDGSFTPNSSYWQDSSIYFNNYSGYCNVSIPSGLTNLSILFGTATATATIGRYLSCGTNYGNWGIWGSAEGIRFIRDSHSTRGLIISVADFLSFNPYNIAITHKSTPAQTFYVDGEQVFTDTTALSYSTNWFFGGLSSTYKGINGYINQFMLFNTVLTASQIAYLSDNPYFLLHRVPPVFYSVPGGAITITTSLDGKVIIRTATAALLDCMASIKNNASNILDGTAVVSTTKTDAIDGKTILKSVASSIFDSKASVLSIASLLLDGNAIVSDTGSALLDGKGAVKDSAYDLIDGKSIIKSMNTAILDGKSIFLSAGTTVIDGKIIVNADGFSSSLLDGKTSIKSVATNYIDGLIYIGNAADKNIDGKAIIKSSLGLTMDGKTTIKDVSANLLDGSASISTSIANIVDGKIVISDAAIGLLDGNATILDDSSIVLDGKVFLSSGAEINVFDGKITLSVPIVVKVTVSFSMKTPAVIFSMKTPAATLSIN